MALFNDNYEAQVALSNEAITEQSISTNPTIGLSFGLETISPVFAIATITIPVATVNRMYHEAANSQQQIAQVAGFNRGDIPIAYVKQKYKEILTSHLKEFFLRYCIASFLYQELRNRKMVIAGEPTLSNIYLEPDNDGVYTFELSVIPKISIFEWRYLPFKAPKRKNYKDLDRQVELFINDEKELQDSYKQEVIVPGDWINFDISITDHGNIPLFSESAQNFWFKIGQDDSENPLRELFIGKKPDAAFYSQNKDLQNYFSDQLDTNYQFKIEVKDIIPHAYFCLENFKRHFRIKTNKELQQKLIEIFSFRNDISQRREIIEEALTLLLSKHQLSIPEPLIMRQKNLILEVVKENPDYPVYRVQPDFLEQVSSLAEKQVLEMIFADQLSYHENLTVNHADLKSYLNLTNRPRMKEFIYFDLPNTKIQDQEMPIATEDLKRSCLREKMLNYAIFHLMKK